MTGPTGHWIADGAFSLLWIGRLSAPLICRFAQVCIDVVVKIKRVEQRESASVRKQQISTFLYFSCASVQIPSEAVVKSHTLKKIKNLWGRSELNHEINTPSSWMKSLPEGIFRKAASGSFMTYFFLSFCLCPPSFSPQHCEESQLKRTRGNSYAERFKRLQGQPNSRRIHRQQFQRQKEWQVTRMC